MFNCILSIFKKKENKLESTKPIYYITKCDYESLDVRQKVLLHSKYSVIEQTVPL